MEVRGIVRQPAQLLSGASHHPLDRGVARRTTRRVLRWGRRNFRAYLWRTERNPWLSFVAEFLLQRTRASQVEPVFGELSRQCPTPALFAAAPTTIKRLLRPLGLHRRAQALSQIATQLVCRDEGLPESMEGLCKLKGVGMYTAAAWLSLHRGKRAVILDANICRWLSRMTGLPYNRDPRNVRWIQYLADDLTPRRVFRDYNYAVLDFTMNVCTPRNPTCSVCPLSQDCAFHGSGKTDSISSDRYRMLYSESGRQKLE